MHGGGDWENLRRARDESHLARNEAAVPSAMERTLEETPAHRVGVPAELRTGAEHHPRWLCLSGRAGLGSRDKTFALKLDATFNS